jgi:hypothetical protein
MMQMMRMKMTSKIILASLRSAQDERLATYLDNTDQRYLENEIDGRALLIPLNNRHACGD